MFIPKDPVNCVLISGDCPTIILEFFKKRGIRSVQTPPLTCLPPFERYHADMQVFPLSQTELLVEPTVYEYYQNAFLDTNIKIKKGTAIGGNYPHSIAYNVARIGQTAFARKAYAEPQLLRELESRGVTVTDVRQGYAKCSAAIVNDHALITADKNIEAAVKHAGLDVLCIQPGGIALPGCEYGFIGGACGLLSPDEMLFIGDVTKHPDYNKIKDFLSEHNKRCVAISGVALTDVGSVIPLRL